MTTCKNCGTNMEVSMSYCPVCGTLSRAQEQGSGSQTSSTGSSQTYSGVDRNSDDVRDAVDNKVMGILAYLSILVVIPLFGAKESRFARYHANQGLILLILTIGYSLVTNAVSRIFYAVSWVLGGLVSNILGLGNLAILALVILGIINVVRGEKKPLPIIGQFEILK